jgi:hypothetical protein
MTSRQIMKGNHITVVEAIYYTAEGQQPTAVETRFTRRVTSDEQVWTRRIKIGAEWVRLDTGWLDKPSLVVLSNEAGKGLQTYPSEGEKQNISGRIIEVGQEVGTQGMPGWYIVPFCLILPGEGHRLHPILPVALYARCRQGESLCILSAFP